MYTVSWFSAGVSSAVATKLAINEIDEIIYTHIDDQHPDTMRFVKDCEKWFGKEVTIIQSPYKTVENVCLSHRFINGPHGAVCTRLLKKRVRIEWEMDNEDNGKIRYVWGMDCSKREKKRAENLIELMPQQEHIFPLIEKNIGKQEAHEILFASGIKRPQMYELGYRNNNCLGCTKGGMGYWNKIRRDFPDVFKKRAEMERLIGASCINGVFLDELDPSCGNEDDEINDDCGIMCELMRLQ